MSDDCYKSIKTDNSLFQCYCCYRARKEEQLADLQRSIHTLQQEVSSLKKCVPTASLPRDPNQAGKPVTLSYAATVSGVGGESPSASHSNNSRYSAKRYNMELTSVQLACLVLPVQNQTSLVWCP